MEKNSLKINIAIDGPSGAGKSTVSNEVARKLGYVFINTGSFYRAIALNAIENNVDVKNENEIVKLIEQFDKKDIEIDRNEHIFFQKKDITLKIRADIISKAASTIAVYKKVREFVVSAIQEITKSGKGYIMDGRDTTFRIMPYAEIKIFLTATPEERTRRRIKQNAELGYNTNFDIVLKEVKDRDYQDTHRQTDPLHKVPDAIEIDCTKMNFDQVVDKVIEIVNDKAQNGK